MSEIAIAFGVSVVVIAGIVGILLLIMEYEIGAFFIAVAFVVGMMTAVFGNEQSKIPDVSHCERIGVELQIEWKEIDSYCFMRDQQTGNWSRQPYSTYRKGE